jgi:hypothetical protein
MTTEASSCTNVGLALEGQMIRNATLELAFHELLDERWNPQEDANPASHQERTEPRRACQGSVFDSIMRAPVFSVVSEIDVLIEESCKLNFGIGEFREGWTIFKFLFDVVLKHRCRPVELALSWRQMQMQMLQVLASYPFLAVMSTAWTWSSILLDKSVAMAMSNRVEVLKEVVVVVVSTHDICCLVFSVFVLLWLLFFMSGYDCDP